LDVPANFNIPAASCKAERPAVGVPFIGAELAELEELPFDAVGPLGAVLIGVEVDELEEPPLDVLDPLLELDGNELAEAPHAVITSTRMLDIVIAIIFFI
jgi:hypothetical protein